MEGQFGVQTAPFSLADVEKALREHDASRQAIQELFKFAHTESQQIINKIRQQVNWPHKHIKTFVCESFMFLKVVVVMQLSCFLPSFKTLNAI